MEEFAAGFLISLAESANIQRISHELWPWQTFSGANGWQVMVYYDVGELDYIELFVTPDGRKVEIWDWPESDEKKRAVDWPGD